MTRRITVSHDGIAKDAQRYLVAHDGIVKPIVRALVCVGGVVKQYWPQALTSDASITWPIQFLETNNYEILAGAPSICRIDFIAAGTYTYSDDPDDTSDVTTGPIEWLDSPVTAIEQYIIKFEKSSGDNADIDVSSDVLDTWLDMFSARAFAITQPTQGNAHYRVVSYIAAVDPAQLPTLAPLAGTEHRRKIWLTAYVTDSGNDIAWNTAAWNIAEAKIGADADCILTFNPNGTATAIGDNSEAANWHNDAPSPASPGLFNVTLNKISGDDPTSGPALATPLTLDVVREWIMLSGVGDGVKTGTFDAIVDDGVDSVTRRIVLTSERTEGVPDDVVWTDTDQLVAAFSPLFNSGDAVATLTMNTLGRGIGTVSPLGTPFTEDWHSGAPTASNPEDYECFVTKVSGDDLDTGPPLDTWLSLSSNRVWTMVTDETLVLIRQGWFDVTVRVIGNALSAVTKRIRIQATSETGE